MPGPRSAAKPRTGLKAAENAPVQNTGAFLLFGRAAFLPYFQVDVLTRMEYTDFTVFAWSRLPHNDN